MGKIGRFELVEEIGAGSMGIVYLARDPMIGRWVAVKKLTGIKGRSVPPDLVRRLLIHEARNVGALEHPGIVTVFDLVEDREGRVEALAMEYVGGRSLRQRLDDPEPLPLKQTSEIITAVGEVLDYAHENGCVHRDVKPANILLGSDGVIKVADFGIAALRGEDLATELRNLGTPNYLAPERVLGDPGDHRADIYSLGVMLYEMLTRHLPYRATSIAKLVRKVAHEEPTPPEHFVPGMMPGLVAVLETALAKDPDGRFSTAGELACAVREIFEAQAALNDTVPAPVPLRPAADPVEPECEAPAVTVVETVAASQIAGPQPLGPGTRTGPVSLPDASDASLDAAEIEEVEWASPDAPGPQPQNEPYQPLARLEKLRKAAWLAAERLREPATRLAQRASGLARSGVEGLRRRPALAAVVVFAVTLPLLLTAFGTRDTAQPVVTRSADPFGAKRLALLPLANARLLLDAGDFPGASAALERSEALYPLAQEPGLVRRIETAAAQELERLDAIAAAVESAQFDIARSRFRSAGAAISELVLLQASEDTLIQLESALRRARQRHRAALAARGAEAEESVPAAAPAPKPVRLVAQPKAAPKTGPGELHIRFSSARPRGVLTVFSGERQVLNRRFRFVEKKNFLVRRGTSGSFEEILTLPEGSRALRFYLTQPKQATQLRELFLEIRPGETSSVRIAVEANGKLTVARATPAR